MNKLLEKFIPTANMLAETLGKDCQIELYDLTDQECSAVYVVNDFLNSGETVSQLQPVLAQLFPAKGSSGSYFTNHLFITGDKRLIRTSVSGICNDEGEVVGAFCIHIDTKKTADFVNWLLESLTVVPEMEMGSTPKNGAAVVLQQSSATHISEIAGELINQIIGDRIASEMSRDDKMAVVSVMEQKGLFLVKGAIEKVAEKLGIAKVTVYSYLDEIKDKGEKQTISE